MSKTALKDRNAFSEKADYDRKTQVKIIRAQLREQLGKKPDCIEASLINACCVCMCSLHDMQEQFIENGVLNPKYERRLYSLSVLLGKLRLKSKAPKGPGKRKGQGKDLDLSTIINEDG